MEVSVALIQASCTSDPGHNLKRQSEMVRDAAAKEAQVICLQELFSSQYFPQTVNVENYDFAEAIPNDTTDLMQKFAAELSVVLIVPVYEMAMPGVYFNTAVIIDADGSILGKYRKNHIPEGPQYLEKYYFTPGNLGYPVFKTKYGKIGVGICWDEWFPEVSRILSLNGAEMIFYPTAIGSEPDHPDFSSQSAWETAIKAQGIMNGLFVAAVNRVGQEGNMSFYGGSFISDPFGKILAKSEQPVEDIVVAKFDLEQIALARKLFQFHRDRRPDTYGLIQNINLEV